MSATKTPHVGEWWIVKEAGPWRVAQVMEDKVLITIGDGATFLIPFDMLEELATERTVAVFQQEDVQRDGVCHWAAAAHAWLRRQEVAA